MPSPVDTKDIVHLRAIIDMGSNGIRFSIVNMSPPTARTLPTIYHHRESISLYEVQYSSGTKQPIPKETMSDVVTSFVKFKQTCHDFSVPPHQIRVLATEATREAINSEEFLTMIEMQLGWKVELLSKEDEARFGAFGIASGFRELRGPVMDLGGGSTQLAFVEMKDGNVSFGNGAHPFVSMPYGAAAISERLRVIRKERDPASHRQSYEDLVNDMKIRLKEAFDMIGLPKQPDSPLPMYLSGGGFRGWGNALMDAKEPPYPIPVINGFSVPLEEFKDTEILLTHVNNVTEAFDDENRNESGKRNDVKADNAVRKRKIFRVSKRRAKQLPAVALLVSALAAALEEKSIPITNVIFASGGVREGALFSELPQNVRVRRPLYSAVTNFRNSSTDMIEKVILDAIPKGECRPPRLFFDVLPAYVSLLELNSSDGAEMAAARALRVTTSGPLAGTRGLGHDEIALIALLLAERWGGDLPRLDAHFADQLKICLASNLSLETEDGVDFETRIHMVDWWYKFIGRLGAVYGGSFSRHVLRGPTRFRLFVKSGSDGYDNSGKKSMMLGVINPDNIATEELKDLEKLGKRKNFRGGEDGYGIRFKIHLSEKESSSITFGEPA